MADIKKEKSKVSAPFKKLIEEHIMRTIEEDPNFEDRVNLEDKSVDLCITYILNSVKKSGAQGLTDAEVYGMVNHYYDEDKIDVGKDINAQIVVNHTVELTQEEKDKALQDAKDKVINNEMVRLRKKPVVLKKVIKNKKEKDNDIPKAGEQISMF